MMFSIICFNTGTTPADRQSLHVIPDLSNAWYVCLHAYMIFCSCLCSLSDIACVTATLCSNIFFLLVCAIDRHAHVLTIGGFRC